MSTIAKIDPNVREARKRRRYVVHEVNRAAAQAPTAEAHFALQRLAKALNRIRMNTTLPGWVKEEAFKIILQRSRAAA